METIVSKSDTSETTQSHHDLIQTILNNLYRKIAKLSLRDKISPLSELYSLTEHCLDLLVHQINVGEKNGQLSLIYAKMIGNKQWKNKLFPLSETISTFD